jgi:hypothetical protein
MNRLRHPKQQDLRICNWCRSISPFSCVRGFKLAEIFTILWILAYELWNFHTCSTNMQNIKLRYSSSNKEWYRWHKYYKISSDFISFKCMANYSWNSTWPLLNWLMFQHENSWNEEGEIQWRGREREYINWGTVNAVPDYRWHQRTLLLRKHLYC